MRYGRSPRRQPLCGSHACKWFIISILRLVAVFYYRGVRRMEYNEIAAKRRKKLKTYAFMRLLRFFAAIFFPHSVAYAAASSV